MMLSTQAGETRGQVLTGGLLRTPLADLRNLPGQSQQHGHQQYTANGPNEPPRQANVLFQLVLTLQRPPLAAEASSHIGKNTPNANTSTMMPIATIRIGSMASASCLRS